MMFLQTGQYSRSTGYNSYASKIAIKIFGIEICKKLFNKFSTFQEPNNIVTIDENALKKCILDKIFRAV